MRWCAPLLTCRFASTAGRDSVSDIDISMAAPLLALMRRSFSATARVERPSSSSVAAASRGARPLSRGIALE